MAKTSSWVVRLNETARLMPLCLISHTFQNGVDLSKPLIGNGSWPVLKAELCPGIARVMPAGMWACTKPTAGFLVEGKIVIIH